MANVFKRAAVAFGRWTGVVARAAGEPFPLIEPVKAGPAEVAEASVDPLSAEISSILDAEIDDTLFAGDANDLTAEEAVATLADPVDAVGAGEATADSTTSTTDREFPFGGSLIVIESSGE